MQFGWVAELSCMRLITLIHLLHCKPWYRNSVESTHLLSLTENKYVMFFSRPPSMHCIRIITLRRPLFFVVGRKQIWWKLVSKSWLFLLMILKTMGTMTMVGIEFSPYYANIRTTFLRVAAVVMFVHILVWVDSIGAAIAL